MCISKTFFFSSKIYKVLILRIFLVYKSIELFRLTHSPNNPDEHESTLLDGLNAWSGEQIARSFIIARKKARKFRLAEVIEVGSGGFSSTNSHFHYKLEILRNFHQLMGSFNVLRQCRSKASFPRCPTLY